MTGLQLLLAGVLLLATLYGGALALLWAKQERLIFQPDTLPADFRFDVLPDVHERSIEVPGARLSALHLQLPAPRGVVFYLHGNAGNLDSWFVNAEFYRRANFDLFMIDYRGYGKSSGHIDNEAQLQADVRAAWATIAPQYQGRRVVVFGRSLGTPLAAGLAAEVQPQLTVLVSPFVNLRALAAEHFPWVPGWLLRYPLATDRALARLQGPVLLLHGSQDTLIPPSHSDRLAAALPAAQLLTVAGAGHNDIHTFTPYLEALRSALDAL
jgi:uncharacterized protein